MSYLFPCDFLVCILCIFYVSQFIIVKLANAHMKLSICQIATPCMEQGEVTGARTKGKEPHGGPHFCPRAEPQPPPPVLEPQIFLPLGVKTYLRLASITTPRKAYYRGFGKYCHTDTAFISCSSYHVCDVIFSSMPTNNHADTVLKSL